MEDFQTFVNWAFQALVAGGIGYAAISMSKMRDSVEKLNESIAKIIVKMEWHKEKIDDHSERIQKLETSKPSLLNQGS